jgi:hypothetical protein
MSKPIFFTPRKEIARSDVSIRLLERKGELSRFEANIDLSRYKLRADANLVIEAYNTAYFKRFSIGALGNLRSRVHSEELKGMEPGDQPHFRVKVIASHQSAQGQVLAAIDEVRPTTDDNQDVNSLLPLLPKRRELMGDELWRVHFVESDELYPELWINRDVDGLLGAIMNNDAQITALIMPEVFRQVLRGMLANGAPWTDEGELGRWLVLARRFTPEEYGEWDESDIDSSRKIRFEWIDDVVKSFVLSHRFFDLYKEKSAEVKNA